MILGMEYKIMQFSRSILRMQSSKQNRHSLMLLASTTYPRIERNYSSKKDRKSWTVLTNNGQIICCWHPEEAPPYEHTKPLPKIDPEFHEGDSVLKVQYRRDAKNRFQPDGPTKEELAKLTYTTKHRWYPNNEKKYLPDPPIDREGI